MIYFLYGEDTYSIKKTAKKMAADFVEKEKSDLNLQIITPEKLTSASFVNAVFSTPFLGERKLVIVRNLLLEGDKELKDQIKSTLDKLPAFTKIIFVEEGKPDAREGLFKFLVKFAKSKNFLPANDGILRQMILKKGEQAGIKIGNQTIAKLILFIGSDLWRMENELLKLFAFSKSQKRSEILPEDLDNLVMPKIDVKIFDLTDALANKNTKKAIQLLKSFAKAGHDLYMVLNMIIYQFRNMLVVDDLVGAGKKDEIAEITGLHPFVVQKCLQSLSKFKKGELATIYNRLYETDWLLKTGQMEIGAGLDLLLVDFCESGKIALGTP